LRDIGINQYYGIKNWNSFETDAIEVVIGTCFITFFYKIEKLYLAYHKMEQEKNLFGFAKNIKNIKILNIESYPIQIIVV